MNLPRSAQTNIPLGYTNLEETLRGYALRAQIADEVGSDVPESARRLFLTYARHLILKVLQINSNIKNVPFRNGATRKVAEPVAIFLCMAVNRNLSPDEIKSDLTDQTEADWVRRMPHKKVVQTAYLVRQRVIQNSAN